MHHGRAGPFQNLHRGKMRKIRGLIWFVLGFAAYPALFVPLGNILAPEFMEWWVFKYADYLRLWPGF